MLEGEKEHDVTLLGSPLCVHSIKEHGYLRSWRRAQSSSLFRDEVPVILNLALLLGESDTFVDIGANVGIFVLTLARMQRLYPAARFLAFEANPDTFSRLNPNAVAQGIQTYNVALSDHEGMLEFVGGAVSNIFSTVDNASAYSLPGEKMSVPCKRLDGFDVPGNSIVLKIDVEGHEKEVLNGAAGLFDAGRVKAVYLDGYKDPDVEQFLTRRGFELFDGATLAPTKGGIFRLLALRKSKRG
jgi:FkbM family methyltransferase